MKVLTRSLVFILIFVLAFQGNVYAYNYDFDTSYEDKQFGSPTSSNHAHDTSTNENARNDKNVSLYPPNYGVFSGDIPTEQTSPYHEQDTKDGEPKVVHVDQEDDYKVTFVAKDFETFIRGLFEED